MKAMASLFMASALGAAVFAAAGSGGEQAGTTLNVLEMESVPAGNYLLNLRAIGAEERRVNVEVKNGWGRCVNSSDSRLKGFEGQFELIGNGVFLVVFRNKDYTATQWWLFRPDGTARVKESPDRGEKQRAIPVSNQSIDPPKPAQ
jgi:hypothetical protein